MRKLKIKKKCLSKECEKPLSNGAYYCSDTCREAVMDWLLREKQSQQDKICERCLIIFNSHNTAAQHCEVCTETLKDIKPLLIVKDDFCGCEGCNNKLPIPKHNNKPRTYCCSNCKSRALAQRQKKQRAIANYGRVCQYTYCYRPIPPEFRIDAAYCCDRCRKSARNIRNKDKSIEKRLGRRCRYRECNNFIPPTKQISAKYCDSECKIKEETKRKSDKLTANRPERKCAYRYCKNILLAFKKSTAKFCGQKCNSSEWMENRLDEIHGKNRTRGLVKIRNTKKKAKPTNIKKKKKLNGNKVVHIKAERLLVKMHKEREAEANFNHNKKFFRGFGSETAPAAVMEENS